MSNQIYWQHAAGDKDRNYADICLQWDVILNGPGYAGPLPDCKDELLKDGWTSKKITGLLRFSHEMKDGDLVVLRLGTTDILREIDELIRIEKWYSKHKYPSEF